MKENKIVQVILTDTHLFEKYSKKDSLIECNYEEVYKAFEQAIALAKKHNLKQVVHAGDFFDSRKHQSQTLLEMAYSILTLFKKEDMQLVLVVGNHDKTDYRATFSFMSVFQDHPNLRLIEEYDWCDDHNNKIRYHYIAYFDNDIYQHHLDNAINHIHVDYKNILITHIGIHGALRNSGEKEASSLTFEMFSEFDKVLIGHFHNYSSHVANKIVYIGSALQHNFGEDQAKGIILLDNRLKFQRIKTAFKPYETITADVADIAPEDVLDLIVQSNTAHQRLQLTGDEKLIKAFDKSKLIEHGIKCVSKPTVIEIKEVEQRIESHSSNSILESFSTYCTDNSYNEEEGLVYLQPIIK